MPFGFVHSLPLKSLQNKVRSPPIPVNPVNPACMGDEADGADGQLRNTKKLSVGTVN